MHRKIILAIKCKVRNCEKYKNEELTGEPQHNGGSLGGKLSKAGWTYNLPRGMGVNYPYNRCTAEAFAVSSNLCGGWQQQQVEVVATSCSGTWSGRCQQQIQVVGRGIVRYNRQSTAVLPAWLTSGGLKGRIIDLQNTQADQVQNSEFIQTDTIITKGNSHCPQPLPQKIELYATKV
jgi:hypothetical protein